MFLQKQKPENILCRNCILNKKHKSGKLQLNNKVRTPIIHKEGNGEILVILEMTESIEVIRKLKSNLKEHNIFNYTLVAALKCHTDEKLLPSPQYEIYKQCNSTPKKIINEINPKAILTFGRGLYAITTSKDIQSWDEFIEYQFNPTFFYTEYNTKEKIRVYPLPPLKYFLFLQDSFESFYINIQFQFLKEYLSKPHEFIVKDRKRAPYELIYVENPNEFLLKYTPVKCECAWDLETNSLNHFIPDFKIGCLTLTFDGLTGYYLPFEKIDLRILDDFFKNKHQILANGKYDTKALKLLGLKNCRVDQDITILFHMLSTERTRNGLKILAWLIGFGGYDKKLDKVLKEYKIDNYLDVPLETLFEYATLDPIVTYRIYKLGLRLARKQPTIYELYKNTIIPVIPVFEDMEIEGMEIDIEYLNKLNKELTLKIEEMEKELKSEIGSINLNSGEQLGKTLELLGFPEVDRTKKGYYKTGDEQLKAWAKAGYKIADRLIEYKSTVKLRSAFVGEVNEECESIEEESGFSFFSKDYIKNGSGKEEKIEGLAKFIQSDGKVHSTYGVARAGTLRQTNSDPNIQQAPKRGKEGKIYRPIFKCPEDYLFMEADYDGFHLRIQAVYSGDKVMEDVFINQSGDMHSTTAVNIFARDMTLEEFLNVKKEEPCKTYRGKSKNLNFLFIFGGSSYGVKPYIEQTWTDEEINQYINDNNLEIKLDWNKNPDPYLTVAIDLRKRFFKAYPELEPYIEKQKKKAEKNGYVDCMLGGRRHTPYLTYIGKDSDKRKVNKYHNISTNSPTQLFEAVIMDRAMIKIHKIFISRKMKSKIIAMIHDSICFLVHKSEIKEVYRITENEMSIATEIYGIPFSIGREFGAVLGFGTEVDDNTIDNFILENNY